MTHPIQSIQWIAGGAQGNNPALYDGDQYLCAVGLRGGRWEFAVVTIRVDDSVDEPVAEFEVEGDVWGWDWSDVDWYVPIKFLSPPVVATEQPLAGAQ